MACKDFSRSVFHGTFFTGRFSQGVFHGGRRPPRKSGRVTPVACEDFSRGIFHGAFFAEHFSRGMFHRVFFTGHFSRAFYIVFSMRTKRGPNNAP